MRRIPVLTICLLFATLLAAAAGLPSAARPVLAQPPPACDWTGVWLPFEGQWRLAQNGTSVTGSYLDGRGLVSGTLDGPVLRGTWREAPTYSPPFEAGHFTITISADCGGFVGTWGLGDADCCNVLSAIRDDNPPPSLAVQVERGALIVDGQTITAGATYFPPNCPPSGRSPTDECASFVLGSETGLKFSCFLNRFLRVLLVLDRAELDEADIDLIIDVIAVSLRERCGLSTVRQGEWAFDLAVRQGAAHVSGVIDGPIRVAAGPAAAPALATATLDGPGSFLAGYDPAAGQATFHAYAAPLTVQPPAGPAFTLPPYSRVEVTAAGPGPVTPLTNLYLPMQSR